MCVCVCVQRVDSRSGLGRLVRTSLDASGGHLPLSYAPKWTTMHCIVFTPTLLLFCLEPGVVATPLFDGKLGLRENECLGARKVWGACHVAVDTPPVAPAQIVIYLGLLPFVCLLLPLFILKQTCYSAVGASPIGRVSTKSPGTTLSVRHSCTRWSLRRSTSTASLIN